MKVAYVGDILNYGKNLQTIGTSMIITLSRMPEIECIDVYCPEMNSDTEDFITPNKMRIIEAYEYDNPLSLLKLMKFDWQSYDRVVINLLATGFGSSSLANIVGLMTPFLINFRSGKDNVEVVYHNSTYTNDFRKLGYNSAYDRVRGFFLSIIERQILKHIKTFVFLNIYKKRIDEKISRNRVEYLNGQFLEAITTVYLNGMIDNLQIDRNNNDIPVVLMHGSWGPQKNLKLALEALRRAHETGLKFKIIISGKINHHFPEYEKIFKNIITDYSDLDLSYIGSVSEKEILSLFLKSDLILIPYNTPGGHSGVLEQALFFEIPTLVMDFPEYREQVDGMNKTTLTTVTRFSDDLLSALNSQIKPNRNLGILNKINDATCHMKLLVV